MSVLPPNVKVFDDEVFRELFRYRNGKEPGLRTRTKILATIRPALTKVGGTNVTLIDLDKLANILQLGHGEPSVAAQQASSPSSTVRSKRRAGWPRKSFSVV